METDFPQMMSCGPAEPEPQPAADPAASPQQRFPRLWLLLTRDPDTDEGRAARGMLAAMTHQGVGVNLWLVWRELGQLALEDFCTLLRIPWGLYRDRALQELLEQSGEMSRLRQAIREAQVVQLAVQHARHFGPPESVLTGWRPSQS